MAITARLISFSHRNFGIDPLLRVKMFCKQFVLSQSNCCFGLALASSCHQDIIANAADEQKIVKNDLQKTQSKTESPIR